MTRLNLILYFVLIFTALGSVTAQHKARKLYIELQQQQEAARQYEIEWGQLQLEQSTWAMHSRIEEIAAAKLHMQVPDNKRIQVVMPVVPKAADANTSGQQAQGDAQDPLTEMNAKAEKQLTEKKEVTVSTETKPVDAMKKPSN